MNLSALPNFLLCLIGPFILLAIYNYIDDKLNPPRPNPYNIPTTHEEELEFLVEFYREELDLR